MLKLLLFVLGFHNAFSVTYKGSRRIYGRTINSSTSNTIPLCNDYVEVEYMFDDTSDSLDLTVTSSNIVSWFAVGFPHMNSYYDKSASLMKSYSLVYRSGTIEEYNIKSYESCDTWNTSDCFTKQSSQDLNITDITITSNTIIQLNRKLDTGDPLDFAFDLDSLKLCKPILMTIAIGDYEDFFTLTPTESPTSTTDPSTSPTGSPTTSTPTSSPTVPTNVPSVSPTGPPSFTYNSLHSFGSSYVYIYDIAEESDNSVFTASSTVYTIQIDTAPNATFNVTLEMDPLTKLVNFTVTDQNHTSPLQPRAWAISLPDIAYLGYYSISPIEMRSDYTVMWGRTDISTDCVIDDFGGTPNTLFSPVEITLNDASCNQPDPIRDQQCREDLPLQSTSSYARNSINGYEEYIFSLPFKTCHYEFNPFEYRTCRPLTIISAISPYTWNCWFLVGGSGLSPTHNVGYNQIFGGPTQSPTQSPTKSPSKAPTRQPTKTPTKAPTAPHVKYWGSLAWTTTQNNYDMSIDFFIRTGAPYDTATIKMTGPNNLTWSIFFMENAPPPLARDLFLAAVNGSSGYLIHPTTDELIKGGEVFFDSDLANHYNYTGYLTKYTQNSIINEFDISYNPSTSSAMIQFTRDVRTGDNEDWNFNLSHSAAPFQVCYIVADIGFYGVVADSLRGSQNNYGCNEISLDSNFGVRGRWLQLATPVQPYLEIYFEFSPYDLDKHSIGHWRGYVIKPINTWIQWGKWYYSNESTILSVLWSATSFCDSTQSGVCGKAQWLPETAWAITSNYNTSTGNYSAMNGYHRMNFSINDIAVGDGWDHYRFLKERVILMNVLYGEKQPNGIQNELSGAGGVYNYTGVEVAYLDYITAAPTLAPTLAPSNAPSNAPSLAPSNAPSNAPSLAPSNAPSLAPSNAPSQPPTNAPSNAPSLAPSLAPSNAPSNAPSGSPSQPPTVAPSGSPSQPPSNAPSIAPSGIPSLAPSQPPTNAPSIAPSTAPTSQWFCQWFCFDEIYDEFNELSNNTITRLWSQAIADIYDNNNNDELFTDTSICNSVESIEINDLVCGIDDDVVCTECCIMYYNADQCLLLESINDDILEFAEAFQLGLTNISAVELLSVNYINDSSCDDWCEDCDDCTVTDLDEPDTTSDCDEDEYSVTCDKKCGPFKITFTHFCTEQRFEVDITYSEFAENWFGLVFNDHMSGNALVYTVGKDEDNQRDAALYAYIISAQTVDGVNYDSSSDWMEVSSTENTQRRLLQDGEIQVIYQQDLSEIDLFTGNTDEITFRYAIGSSLLLSQHSSTSDTITVNLVTGDVDSSSSSLQLIHGIIQIVAWSLFCSLGIIASSHRFIFRKNENKKIWFKYHKILSSLLVLFSVIGFILAIVFTISDSHSHFDSLHKILGLIVTIILILQPLLSAIRPQPTDENEKKKTSRFLWELFHKGFGYASWFTAQFVIYLGIEAYSSSSSASTADVLHIIHYILFGIMLIIYMVLWCMSCYCIDKNKHFDPQLQSDHINNNTPKRVNSVELISPKKTTKGATFEEDDDDVNNDEENQENDDDKDKEKEIEDDEEEEAGDGNKPTKENILPDNKNNDGDANSESDSNDDDDDAGFAV